MKAFSIAAALLVFCFNANATLVTIDPDAYAVGTNLSNVSSQAVISEWISDGTSARFEDVYALPSTRAASGTNVFGHASHPGQSDLDWRLGQYTDDCANGECSIPIDVLRVDFATPTKYAEVWSTTDHFTFIDGAFFTAYRADNSVVDRCYLAQTSQYEVNGPISGGAHTVGSNQPCGQIERTFACADPIDPLTCYYGHSMFVASDLGDISYVVFGGNGYSGTYAFADRLSFDIPESASLSLFLAGLLSLFLVGTRRSGA